MKAFLIDNTTSIAVLIPLLLSILAAIKLIHHVLNTGRTFKVHSLELLYKSQLDDSNPANKLITEQVFQNQFRLATDYDIIKILISHPSPSACIRLYKTSKRYLIAKNGKLAFSEKYSTPEQRRFECYFRPFKNFGLYVICATIGGMLGLLLYKHFNLEIIFEISYGVYNWVWWIFGMIFSIILLLLAFKFLTAESSIKDAEVLEKMFSSLTQKSKIRCY